jgi:hypothetical protein
MPADIVNLRRARKAKARSEKQHEAETNRALFGRTKTEKAKEAAERERAVRSLDSHRRDRGK